MQAKDFPENMILNHDFRIELARMYNAVTELGLWDFFRNESPPEDKGYMWWRDARITMLGNHKEVQKSGHTGFTMAYSMRYMQNLAIKSDRNPPEIQRKI